MLEAITALLNHLGYATPLLYAAVIYWLFSWLDANASEEAKAAIAGAMQMAQIRGAQAEATALVEVFDRVYSNPLLSLRAFFRSALFTTVVTAIYGFSFFSESIRDLVFWASNGALDDSHRYNLWSNLTFVGIILVTNIVSDYVSLFAVRATLTRYGKRPIFALIVGALIGLLIVIIFALVRAGLVGAFVLGWKPDGYVPFLLLLELNLLESFIGVEPALIVFIWLPLFALSIVLFRILPGTAWLIRMLEWSLKDCKDHPLKATGYIASIATLVLAFGWRVITTVV
jgi:hypothetical protein